MSDKRIALVGCGRHGRRYLNHLIRDVSGVTPVALWRRNASSGEEIAREHDLRYYSDLPAMLEREDVDGVVITTPPANHLAEILQALDSGKTILVEKPLTAHLGQAGPLQSLPAEQSQRIMLGHTLRYNPTLLAARDHIQAVGEIHRLRLAQRLEPCDLLWQRDPEVAGGGSITLTGVHLFDLLRWLIGRTPDAVQCRMVAMDHPLENCFDACFEYIPEQILCATEVSKFTPSRSSELEILGTRGQLLVDYAGGEIRMREGSRTRQLARIEDRPTLPDLLKDFVRVMRGEIAPPISLEDGLESMKMIDACYRSHSLEQRVSIDETVPPSTGGKEGRSG